MVGAIFCSECGAQLVQSDGLPTSIIHSTAGSDDFTMKDRPSSLKESVLAETPGEAKICLSIMSTGTILPLSGEKEVTLGRVSEGQPIVPDIDLSPFKAYEAGVSRMHASIKLIKNDLMVTDLGSANGTRINGERIASHLPHPIRQGDILTLGKFKIQIIVRTEDKAGG
jgi:hypothetical protein